MEYFSVVINIGNTKKFSAGKYVERMCALGYDATKDTNSSDYGNDTHRTNPYLIEAIKRDPEYALTTSLHVCKIPTMFKEFYSIEIRKNWKYTEHIILHYDNYQRSMIQNIISTTLTKSSKLNFIKGIDDANIDFPDDYFKSVLDNKNYVFLVGRLTEEDIGQLLAQM